MIDQFLWVERYRPSTIDECILPDSLRKTFKEFVVSGQIPNFLFCGTAGVGKTTVAKALCNEIGAEYLIINGSEESGIDVLRTKIKGFASTISLTDSKKVVILDEADYLNPNSTQPALRGFIEEFSSNCRFIFTCNFKNRIIEPLHSRCSVIEFKISSKDKQIIAAKFFKRLTNILTKEGIEFDSPTVAGVVSKYFPDYRRILNEIQRYSASGKIDSGILVNLSDESYRELVKSLKEKDFTSVRKWISSNSDTEPTQLFRDLYDKSIEFLETQSIPEMVLILANYQYKSAFAADQQLNTSAAMVEIMVKCKFK